MFEKLISRLFRRNSPAKTQHKENKLSEGNAANTHFVATDKVEAPKDSGKHNPQATESIDIPTPTRTITISVTSLNRLDFLFYDYLLGPSQASITLNPIEQYILTRVNHALKSPQSVLTHFPVLPQSVIALTNLLNDPDFNLDAFIKVVEKEPSIATELMKKANSPAYKRGNKDITNLQQAFMFMGANDIKEYVLNRFIKQLCQQKPIYFKTFGEKIWLHSQDVATVSKALAAKRNENADAAYTIGLMHDLGKVVIFQFMVEAFKTINPDFKQDSLVFKKFLSEKSMRLSVELMKIWNMPSLIVNAVQGQIEDLENLDQLEPAIATLFEANLISEMSLSYQSQQLETAELLSLVEQSKLRADAKQYLLDSLQINQQQNNTALN
ncbi:HDOD domain-containing protein [Paraglaciecola aquimarina]|uniref:HDOD domain-containing protein n=1 Tax=Paraglaciecola aquimarina TaxID=1235557 RepID=A0ABU3T0Y6_9ALTE|nr:HDOD domain-containing protein [Paraglaciecola aquimarina]MDU0355929.1 HDOD domain-containing protein [Paraglaciecola aquimarina]